MKNHITILGIAGSARSDSRNWGIIKALDKVLPPSSHLVIDTDIISLAIDGSPETSQHHLIKQANIIVISTPQYNFDIPEILKQMLRVGAPNGQENAWQGKPVAIIGASQDTLGTDKAIQHLREDCTKLNMVTLSTPPLLLHNVDQYFDETGQITNQDLLEKLRVFVSNMINSLSAIHTAAHSEPKS